jgi:hypothetical protein
MLHATSVTNVNQIDLKFMESGHSYLEADSMHSTIERAKRHQKIYNTREWEVVVSTARKNPAPYNVMRLTHEDFLNFKELSSHIIVNRSRNTMGKVVNWLKIKHLRFQKSAPHVIQYKYRLSADNFLELNVRGRIRRKQQSDCPSVQQAYRSRLPISAAKKKDLMKLLTDRIIPPEYEEWYRSLPVSDTSRDSLPEPSADEPEPDEAMG